MKSTALLKTEHDLIFEVLNMLQTVAERIETGVAVSDAFYGWAVGFFRTFADHCHHAKEEDRLFPLLEQRGIARTGGPIGVMLGEHELARDYTKRMEQAASEVPPDREAFAAAGTAYAALLKQHIYKENNILFRMADQCLSDQDDSALMQAFRQAEQQHGAEEMRQNYESEIARWRRELSEQSEQPVG